MNPMQAPNVGVGSEDHGYRERPTAMQTPTPETIRKARQAAGLSQTAAAKIVGATLRAWQYWEAGERPMRPATWELFTLKTNTK